MTITLPTLLVQNFQTVRILPLQVYAPDTYIVPIQPSGNSILSAVLVLSLDVGASVQVNYYQTTAANEFEERTNIVSHDLITTGSMQAQQLLVTRIHNKVFAEIIVSGGSANLGLVGSVVSSFATDLETALKRDGQASNLGTDRGFPIVVRDTITGLYQLWEGEGGVPAVRLLGDVQVSLASVTTPAIVTESLPDAVTEVALTVPTGARRFTVKTRTGAPMRLAFALGETSTNFVVTALHHVDNLNATASVTIYARSQRAAGDVLEVLSWS